MPSGYPVFVSAPDAAGAPPYRRVNASLATSASSVPIYGLVHQSLGAITQQRPAVGKACRRTGGPGLGGGEFSAPGGDLAERRAVGVGEFAGRMGSQLATFRAAARVVVRGRRCRGGAGR